MHLFRRAYLDNKGLSLIEVMISLSVFMVLMLIFATSVPMAQKTAKMNGQYAQAISLCQHKIDQVRAVGYGRLNYTELEDAGIIDAIPKTSPYSFTSVDDVTEYLPSPTTKLTIQSLGTDQLKVTASLTWKTAAHQSKTTTASLSAIVTNVE